MMCPAVSASICKSFIFTPLILAPVMLIFVMPSTVLTNHASALIRMADYWMSDFSVCRKVTVYDSRSALVSFIHEHDVRAAMIARRE